MISLDVKVGPASDAVREAQLVSEQLRTSGVSKVAADGAAAQIEALLVPMIAAAKAAATAKARMQVMQSVTGPGYTLRLQVDEGRPSSILDKLRAALGLS